MLSLWRVNRRCELRDKKRLCFVFVRIPLSFISHAYATFSTKLPQKELEVHCKILEVGQSPTEQELRNNFIRLVKKYHPDSRSDEENSEKFSEVRNSYKLLRENFIGLTDDSSEILEKDFKICHTVPQHRRYLSYEGIGYGTPTQRQKQYQQYKIRQGHEKVHEYKIGKLTSQTEFSLAMKDATLARQYKTSHAIERLVEDMIQESISKGEFDNLPGNGKPLKRSTENPYVDSMTHKVNEVRKLKTTFVSS